MKLNANKGDIQVVGDITEFKTGIDPKNLEFITTLLSSNLYSAPEQSFMREIVSNAWDSHVEAGTTSTPVVIQLNSVNETISIRDFGTGLSPERFKEVYCNIGSSTKRESNEFIGGFGIGKYSSLACTNVVNITSYYNHKEYKYLMVKSGNSITTNLLGVLDTEENNGVLVSIRINRDDFYKYGKALQYLVFFPNIYVDSSKYYASQNYFADNIVRSFNDTTIKRYKHFASASVEMKDKILLGNVLYPCDSFKLNMESQDFLRRIKYSGIVICCNIGEINITPNRESIIYTNKTIKILERRIAEAKKELEETLKGSLNKDYDDIIEYLKKTKEGPSYDFVTNTLDYRQKVGSYEINREEMMKLVTYKGKEYNISSFIHTLNHISWPRIKFLIYNSRLNAKTNSFSSRLTNIVKNNTKVISLPKGFRCSYIVKAYLREYYDNYVILDDITEDSIYNCLETDYEDHHRNDADFYNIIREFAKDAIKKVEFIDFNTDKDFLEYKDNYLKENKANTVKDNELIYLYVWEPYGNNDYGYKNAKAFYGIKSVLNYVKELNRLVILDSIDPNNAIFAEAVNSVNTIYITAKKSVIKAIKDADFSNVRDMKYFTHTKTAIKSSTILKYLNNHNTENSLFILDNVSKKFRDDLDDILKLYSKFKGKDEYNSLIRAAELPEDPYTASICKKYLEYNKKYSKVISTVVADGFSSFNKKLVNAIIIKDKIYRVDYSTYKCVKQSKVINILCRK